MIIQAKRYKPNITCSFSTEKGELVLRNSTGKEGDTLNDSVLSVNTDNNLGSDAATFQITLAPNKPWDRILASNDLVKVRMKRRSEDEHDLVFVGLIDDVRKTVGLQGGVPTRTITVTGRSFAKALINFEIGTVPEMNLTLDGGWLKGRLSFVGMSASDIIEQIIHEFIYQYMDYKFKDGSTLKDLFKYHLTSRDGERLYDDTSFVSFQGSIWAFMKEIVNEPFNQIFMDVYGEEATLVTRPTPFNPDSWEKLITHRITDEDVVIDAFGRSDIETYTLYSVGLQNFFSSFDLNSTVNVFPYWYQPYFEKYGLRRLQRFTGYTGYIDEGDTVQAQDKLEEYQKDLYNWNILNPSFLNGFITVIGENNYKVGDRLLYESKEHGETYEFFIEGVSHTFQNYEMWSTRLTVTRGLPKSGAERFADPWGSYTEYEATALGVPAIGDYVEDGGSIGSDGSIEFPTTGNISGTRQNIVAIAQSYVGKVSYRMGWGRNQAEINAGKFDCSSFVHHVYKSAGITLGNVTSVTTDTLVKRGTEVPLSQIQPGDLVFFHTYKHNGHVVIYIGDGKFVGAQSSGCYVGSVSSWTKQYGLGNIRRIIN